MLNEELLRRANEALMKANFEKQQARLNEDRKFIVSQIGKDLAETIRPVIEKVAIDNGEFLKKAIDEIKQIKIPDIVLPDISVPEPRVNVDVDLSSIRIPEPRITVNPILKPEINFPKEMDIKGWVQLMGVDLQNPLPVQLRDASGKPVNLLENLTTIIGGGGGGKQDYFTIKGFGTSAYADYLNGDNRLKVSVETGGGGLTDSELRAIAVPVSQVSGASFSVEATQGGSWAVNQVSGSLWSVYVTGSTATSVALTNSDGATIDPRDRNWTITETLVVSGSLDTVKSSGIARTANPTAVSDGDNVRFSADKLGRQVMTPLQVRNLRATAYASLTNGTETTLLAAVAGAYLDLIYVMGTNNSDAAVTVDLRAVTAGNIQTSIRIPANGTAGVSLPVPIPQDETGNNWTADLPDITGTTVTLSALFSREV